MIDWLLAFAVHSSIWCGIAWLILRSRPKARARIRETIWQTAIAASIITPTVRVALPSELAVWHVQVPVATATKRSGPEHSAPRERGHTDESHALAEEEHHPSSSFVTGYQKVTLWSWSGTALGLILLYIGRCAALRRRLRSRETVDSKEASRTLVKLSRKAGLASPPRLTESDDLGSAIAFGIGSRREICMPSRALHELDHGELSALLGHEVAHHLRRDTIRLSVLNILQAVFFFQPLFRVARREVLLAIEEQCDDWAATQLNDRFAMASCLAEVASWVVSRDRGIPVPCMGRNRSQLAVRVHRLTGDWAEGAAPRLAFHVAIPLGLLTLTAWVAPTVVLAASESHTDSVERETEAAPLGFRHHDGNGEHERNTHEGRQEHRLPEHR